VQHDAALLQHEPPEGVVGLPDLFSQFLNIAARQFRFDARPAGIEKLNLDSLEVNHVVTFLGSGNPLQSLSGI
jgi:hypothetical protein